MRMRQLGRTGIEVSAYCLGTMMFGPNGNPDHDACARIVHRALDGGINFIDTADVYGHSETEQILGRALKGRREDVVLATKFNGPMDDNPLHRGSSRRWIMKAVEDSLRRLNTDYIDLYQIHHPDPHTDIEETLSALTDLVRSGKVRAIGSSNLPASDIVQAHWVSERRGLHRLRTEQPTYSILNRAIEREILPVARRFGMGVLVWSPLAMGLLTGRYRKNDTPRSNARMHWVPRHMTDPHKLDAVEQLIPSPSRPACRSLTWPWPSPPPTRTSPRPSSAPAPSTSSATFWQAPRPCSATPSWTASATSSRRAPTSARSTCPTSPLSYRHRQAASPRIRACGSLRP